MLLAYVEPGLSTPRQSDNGEPLVHVHVNWDKVKSVLRGPTADARRPGEEPGIVSACSIAIARAAMPRRAWTRMRRGTAGVARRGLQGAGSPLTEYF